MREILNLFDTNTRNSEFWPTCIITKLVGIRNIKGNIYRQVHKGKKVFETRKLDGTITWVVKILDFRKSK